MIIELESMIPTFMIDCEAKKILCEAMKHISIFLLFSLSFRQYKKTAIEIKQIEEIS